MYPFPIKSWMLFYQLTVELSIHPLYELYHPHNLYKTIQRQVADRERGDGMPFWKAFAVYLQFLGL